MLRYLVVLLLALAPLTLASHAQKALTAQEIITEMRRAAGITAAPDTVDTFKAGDPQTVVTGIATTISPTMDVLRKAVAAHDNLVITHEPTFYNHLDEDTLFKSDPVYSEKRAYIEAHHLVIFRWHDGWHRRKPDGIIEGWVQQMHWQPYQSKGNQYLFTLPPTPLDALAQQLEAKTGRVIRVVGDPNLPVTHLAYLPGAGGEQRQVAALQRDDVEVVLVGEIPEWETISYAWDAAEQGRHKALILLGHYTSEEPGMQNAAQWLRSVFPNLRVDFIPAGEPYWLAGHPPSK